MFHFFLSAKLRNCSSPKIELSSHFLEPSSFRTAILSNVLLCKKALTSQYTYSPSPKIREDCEQKIEKNEFFSTAMSLTQGPQRMQNIAKQLRKLSPLHKYNFITRKTTSGIIFFLAVHKSKLFHFS